METIGIRYNLHWSLLASLSLMHHPQKAMWRAKVQEVGLKPNSPVILQDDAFYITRLRSWHYRVNLMGFHRGDLCCPPTTGLRRRSEISDLLMINTIVTSYRQPSKVTTTYFTCNSIRINKIYKHMYGHNNIRPLSNVKPI